jgi:hypothetical protein
MPDHWTPDLFFNKAAFVRHPRGFGNAGRNIIAGPGLQNLDFSLTKNTSLKLQRSVTPANCATAANVV